jgi:hypothetical protein
MQARRGNDEATVATDVEMRSHAGAVADRDSRMPEPLMHAATSP